MIPTLFRSIILCAAVLLASPATAARLVLLGVPQAREDLTPEVQAAYDWADSEYVTTYLSFHELLDNPQALNRIQAVWWHYDLTTRLPQEALHPLVLYRLRTFVQTGKGMLLSGFATQYAVDLGFEDTRPDAIFADPKQTGDWGIQKELIPHPIFTGLPNTFATVSAGLEANNNICWWSNPADFNGRWLGDTEWDGGIMAVGAYTPDRGRVVVVGTGAFEWDFGAQTNGQRGTLEHFTKNVIDYAAAAPSDDMVAWWRFDEEGTVSRTREEVLDFTSQVVWRDHPEWTDGVHGNALRFDGNSSWVTQFLSSSMLPTTEMTVEAWVALKSYPTGDAAFINQHAFPDGFFFGIDRYGYWNFSIGSGGEWHTVRSPEPLPKFSWQHVSATLAPDGLRLFHNGFQIAHNQVGGRALTPATSVPVEIGKHNQNDSLWGLFLKDIFNGLMDDVRIYRRALGGQELRDHVLWAQPPSVPALGVPQQRWANDPHRPRFHPIQPNNWANEGYGLIHYRGNYHFFYQHNPNGNILEHMHWGHLVSPNMMDWTSYRTPIWPEPGRPDAQGTWSGDVAVRGDGAVAVYTSNDAGQTQSVAFSGGEVLRDWGKYAGNPVTGAFPPGIPAGEVLGFRDPHIFEANGTNYMVVGSGDAGDGGFLPLFQSDNMVDWNHRGELFRAPIDVAGEMWEMPVFFEIEPGRWVLFANRLPAPTPIYWIGRFENERFIPDFTEPKNLDIGHAFLSPAFGRTPDGRWVGIGIVPEDRSAEEQRAAGWSNCFSIPRRVTLQDGFLGQGPAEEVAQLRTDLLFDGRDITVHPAGRNYLPGVGGNQLDIELRVDMQQAETFGIMVRKSPDNDELTRIGFNRIQDLFVIREESSNLGSVGKWTTGGNHPISADETLDLRIVIDRSVLTVFANGRTAITTRIYPIREDSIHLDFYTFESTATVLEAKVWRMRDGHYNEEWPAHPSPTLLGQEPIRDGFWSIF